MPAGVTIGQRFRDRIAVWNVWEVARIYSDFVGLPHAVVINVADPTDTRTLASGCLRDRRRFTRAAARLAP